MSEYNQRPNEPSFSLYEFKKWLDDQAKFPEFKKPEETKRSDYHVESRIGISRLKDQIAVHNPDIKDIGHLAEAFKESGGRATDSDGIHVTIRVGEQEFKLPKLYTKER